MGYYTHFVFFFNSFCFYFTAAALNTYVVIRADGCCRAKDCMTFIDVINNNH